MLCTNKARIEEHLFTVLKKHFLFYSGVDKDHAAAKILSEKKLEKEAAEQSP